MEHDDELETISSTLDDVIKKVDVLAGQVKDKQDSIDKNLLNLLRISQLDQARVDLKMAHKRSMSDELH